jgi:hypothetical protein
MTHSRRVHRRTRGMAMVEMVFVLPLLILIVFAIAEFGLMFSRWLTLSNAVREGARAGVTFDSPCVAGNVTTRAQNAASSYAKAGGVPLDPADFTVSGACVSNGELKVDANYDFKLNIPFASINTVNLHYSSSMRNE